MPVKRIETLLCLSALFAALFFCFLSQDSGFPASSAVPAGWIGGYENPEFCVDADDATIHDPYFLFGGKTLRLPPLKRSPEGVCFSGSALLQGGILPCAPGGGTAVSPDAESGTPFHEILLSSVFPVRAGPLSA